MSDDTDAIPAAVEFSIDRVFDAPRDLVWTLFTAPEHARRWYGPAGFSAPVYEADLRAGGRLAITMRAPDGQLFPQNGTIVEIDPPCRIVTQGVVQMGGITAFDARTTVSFESRDGATLVAVRQLYTQLNATGLAATSGARQGWEEQHEKFAAYLSARRTS